MARIRVRAGSSGSRSSGGGCFLSAPIFVLAGAALIVFGWKSYRSTAADVQASATATGVVVDYQEREGSEGGTLFALVVEFTAPSGETVRFTDAAASNPAAKRIGESVEVYYDPAYPQAARVKSFLGTWFFPVTLVAIGGIMIVVAVLSFFQGLIRLARMGAAGAAGVGGLAALLLLLRGGRKGPSEPPSQEG